MINSPTNSFPDLTVFIVDDDINMLKALERLLIQHGLNISTFSSATELLKDIDQHSQGCLILDIAMPGVSGLELQKELKSRKINLPTIILTGQADVPKTIQAFKQGALDFIEKPFNSNILIKSVMKALNQFQQGLQKHHRHRDMSTLFENLTTREREVLNKITDGLSNKEIAKQLSISPRTIESHRKNIMEKMQANSIADLIIRVGDINRPH